MYMYLSISIEHISEISLNNRYIITRYDFIKNKLRSIPNNNVHKQVKLCNLNCHNICFIKIQNVSSIPVFLLSFFY